MNEQAKALAELAAECGRANARSLNQIGMGLIDLNAIKRAHDALASPQQAEPPVAPTDLVCAWSVWWRHNKNKYTTARQASLASWNECASRRAPPPAATPPVAEPLSDAEIADLWNESKCDPLSEHVHTFARALLSKQGGSST